MSKQMEIIKKLLNLANSNPNEAEAAAAAEKAAMLALKYGISMEDIKKTQGPQDVNSIVITTTTKYEKWVSYISAGVAKINACHFYSNTVIGGVEYIITGGKNNREVAKLTFEYLLETVKRLNREEVKKRGLTQKQRGAFRKAFRYGAATKLSDRFNELYEDLTTSEDKAQQATGSTALVVSNYYESQREEATNWLATRGIVLSIRKGRCIKLNSHGYEQGRKAGASINLDKQIK